MSAKKAKYRVGKYLAVALLVLTLLAAANSFAKAVSSTTPIVVGFMDTISVTENEFSAQGWVASFRPNRKIVALVIRFGDTKIYEGRYEKYERPDVVATMGRNDWINCGWRVKSVLPTGFKAGKYLVAVQAKIDSGELIEISVNDKNSIIRINKIQSSRFAKIIVLLGLFVCVLIVMSAFYFAETVASRLSQLLGRAIHPVVIITIAIIIFFAWLVAIGVTGSSLKFGIQQSPFVSSDIIRILGQPRPVRSDEWLLITPLAISQTNHIPTFPVINRNIGEDGQNMLIVGMTGVPVSHISAIVKPATWGFHIFDLKRALSWNWWFPIFGCFFSVWAVFSLISPNHWRIGFIVSLSFCGSSYVTAWSYWPAYAVFFPCLILYASVAILRSPKNFSLFYWVMLLGFSLAGFVLILYPPWQVSLGYLFLFIGTGIVLRDKLYRSIKLHSFLAYALALGLAFLILWNWWSDARSAIVAMMNTIYPGQRNSVVGGTITISNLLRGFTNIITLYRMDGGYSNQSEIASFYYFFPSLFVLFGKRLWEKRICPIQFLMLLFLVFTVEYMLVGVPKQFATVTLWGRVPGPRADLSLGLAYILLIGVLLVPNRNVSCAQNRSIMLFAAIVSMIWGAVVTYAIYKIPHETLSGFSSGIEAAILLVILFGSWWLAIGEYRKFLALNLAFSFATVLPFNPIMIAPNRVTPAVDFTKYHSRVLFANTQVPAMLLLASGQPVSNGIFYYPQRLLWERLDPDSSKANIYNRYQHLIFTLGSVATPYYRIESPQADVVKVIVDTAHFDFRKTGASVFVAPSNALDTLKFNQSLEFVSESDGWSRFFIPRLGDK
jgi:hypothetical protein